MPSCRFSLKLSPHSLLEYYRGSGRNVVVMSESGQSLAFPASELRRFVTHAGVTGYFEITFSDQHKLIRLVRIGDHKPGRGP